MEALIILVLIFGPELITIPVAAYQIGLRAKEAYKEGYENSYWYKNLNIGSASSLARADGRGAVYPIVWTWLLPALLWPLALIAIPTAIAYKSGEKKTATLKEREEQLAIDTAKLEKELARLRREGVLPPAIEV